MEKCIDSLIGFEEKNENIQFNHLNDTADKGYTRISKQHNGIIISSMLVI